MPTTRSYAISWIVSLLLAQLFAPAYGTEFIEPYSPMVEEGAGAKVLYLSPNAASLAKQLGILPMIDKLHTLSDAYRQLPDKNTRDEIMFLRQQLTDILQYTSFQVQDVLAAIEVDLAHTDRVYDYLAARKERAELMTNVTTFVTSGTLGILGNSLGFGSTDPAPNVFGTLGGASSTLLPTMNFYPRRYKRPGLSSRRLTMLAQVFGRQPDERTEINSTVWNYLNSVPPGSETGRTRREALLAKWKLLRGMANKSGKLDERYVDVVTGDIKPGVKVNLNLLDMRADLLGDLKAEVARLYRDLAELKASIMAV